MKTPLKNRIVIITKNIGISVGAVLVFWTIFAIVFLTLKYASPLMGKFFNFVSNI